MNLRSHTVDQLRAAVAEGERLYALETGTDGEDDILYGQYAQEVVQDICFHHDLDELPAHWQLEEVGLEVVLDRFGG